MDNDLQPSSKTLLSSENTLLTDLPPPASPTKIDSRRSAPLKARQHIPPTRTFKTEIEGAPELTEEPISPTASTLAPPPPLLVAFDRTTVRKKYANNIANEARGNWMASHDALNDTEVTQPQTATIPTVVATSKPQASADIFNPPVGALPPPQLNSNLNDKRQKMSELNGKLRSDLAKFGLSAAALQRPPRSLGHTPLTSPTELNKNVSARLAILESRNGLHPTSASMISVRRSDQELASSKLTPTFSISDLSTLSVREPKSTSESTLSEPGKLAPKGTRTSLLQSADDLKTMSASITSLDVRITGPSGEVATSQSPSVLPGNIQQRYGTISRKLKGMVQAGTPQSIGQYLRKSPLPSTGSNMALYSGTPFEGVVTDNVINSDLSLFSSVLSVLQARAKVVPKNVFYTALDVRGKESVSITFGKVLGRAEKIAAMLMKKDKLPAQARIILLYRKTDYVDFIVALYGCFLAGAVAVPIVATSWIDQVQELKDIMQDSDARFIFTTDANVKSLNNELGDRNVKWPSQVEWWKTNDIGTYERKKSSKEVFVDPLPSDVAYFEYSHSIVGELRGLEITHASLVNQCLKLKSLHGIGPDDVMLAHMDHRRNIGMIMSVFLTIYTGVHFVQMPVHSTEIAHLWESMATKYRATIALTDYTGVCDVVGHLKPLTNEQLKKLTKGDHCPKLETLRLVFVQAATRQNARVKHFLIQEFKEVLSTFKLSTTCEFVPLLSVSDYGGVVIASQNTTLKCLKVMLDASGLRKNKVLVVNDLESEVSTITLESHGSMCSDISYAVVDPVTGRLLDNISVGEIWLAGKALSLTLHNMDNATKHIFHASLLSSLGDKMSDLQYFRTGILGFVYQKQIFVTGTVVDRMETTNFQKEHFVHYIDDIATTISDRFGSVIKVLAFSVLLNDEELMVIVAEIKNLSKEEMLNLARFMLDTMKSEHSFTPYAIVFCTKGTIPVNKDHSANVDHCRLMFDLGHLNPLLVHFSANVAVTNLPERVVKMKDSQSLDNLQSMPNSETPDIYWQISDGNVLGSAGQGSGAIDKVTGQDLLSFDNISLLLMWRVQTHPEATAYIVLDQKGKDLKFVSYQKLSCKIAQLAHYLTEKKALKKGDVVGLIYEQGLDFAVALHTCLYAGIVAIPLPPCDPENIEQDLIMILEVCQKFKVSHILVHPQTQELLTGKMVHSTVKRLQKSSTRAHPLGDTFPELINTTKITKLVRQMETTFHSDAMSVFSGTVFPIIQVQPVDDTWSYTKMSLDTIIAQCMVMKETLNISTEFPIMAGVRPFSGFGLLFSSLAGVYTGCSTVLLSPVQIALNTSLLWELASRHKVKDLYMSYATIGHWLSADLQKTDITNVESIMLLTNGRPPSLERFLNDNDTKLDPLIPGPVFSLPAHILIASRAYLDSPAIPLNVDMHELRRGRVRITTDFNHLALYDVGRISTCTAAVILSSSGHVCPEGHVGEIWISSPCVVDEFGNASGAENTKKTLNLEAYGVTGWKDGKFIPTGCLGFLYPDSLVSYHANMSEHCDSHLLYVLGRQEDAFHVTVNEDGKRVPLQFFAIDIESTIEHSHAAICPSGCAVFTSDFAEEVVVVVEIQDHHKQANNLLSVIVNAVLEEHQLIIGVIVYIESGTLRKSRLGEKMRGTVKELYYASALDYLSVHNIQ